MASLPDEFAAAARASPGEAQPESADSADRPMALYFGYGSNLSTTQMAERCPNSHAVGLGRLRGWRWLINERGYANVVQSGQTTTAAAATAAVTPSNTTAGSHGDRAGAAVDEVYGVLYVLDAADEAFLDRCEGVPDVYGKETWEVDVVRFAWPASSSVMATGAMSGGGSSLDEGQDEDKEEEEEDDDDDRGTVPALVYVDHVRTQLSAPKPEYVHRMNRGIDEAARQWALPKAYVEKVLRPFIPAPAPSATA